MTTSAANDEPIPYLDELTGDQTRGIVWPTAEYEPRCPIPGRRPTPRKPTARDITIARQNAAGEEDQSVPGWDQGA